MMDGRHLPLKVECSYTPEGSVRAKHVRDEPTYVVSSEAVAQHYWYSWNPYWDSLWAFDAWQQDCFSCRDARRNGHWRGRGRKKRNKKTVELICIEPGPAEADEETWQERIRHRVASVNKIKSSIEYELTAQIKDRPNTPDPTDRSVSKRDWEKKSMTWRHELKALCHFEL